MSRILRADPGWEQALADAVERAPRPIQLDPRLLPRAAIDGLTTRERSDRSAFPQARAAATLLAIYPDADGDLVVPLTVRRDDLRSHAGEVSLPGGTVDPDETQEAAALREAWEEVGLAPEQVRIIGTLDEVWIPVSNFELRPFVGTVATRPQLVPHDAEVAAIVELPLRALWDPEVAGEEEFSVRGFRLRAGVFRFGGVRVWGATAITLGMLASVLDDG
jgi:8-oxo-dGTP pyrophosphatase MutT (NUDIX family)